ncbi:MAG: EMC3/TMCO1 family protein [Promethearchaeota archaeon]
MYSQDSQTLMEWMSTPPGSMFFILILSTIVALISTLLTKLLVDTAELERKQKLIRAHQEEKQEIIKLAETDPSRYRKMRKRWQRKDIMLKKTQQGMALQRLKPTCITFIPMMVIFFILRGIYGTFPVAKMPMNAYDVPFLGNLVSANTGDAAPAWTALIYGEERSILPRHGWINFTAWYFICSLGINTLMQRVLKLQTQASGGMEQMFKSQKAQAMDFPDI